MIVEISVKDKTERYRHTDVIATYQDGVFFVLRGENETYKYPLESIWRIKESNESTTDK